MIRRRPFFFLCTTLTLLCLQGHAQNSPVTQPKLVVGIVVDQMRWDYLYRYYDKYSAGGFKRLLNGYSCENTHINYLPTYTGPGHSCIYTGSVPAIHGIAGNSWYDRQKKRSWNCVEDTTETLVGPGKMKGQASPRNLLVTTITDQLRLSDNFQSKVISLALKDRSAILPGGHTANCAYYMDGNTGNFITTTYYRKDLPDWVNAFNAKKEAEKYLSSDWNTLLPIDQYTESTKDNEPYERPFKGETDPVFPHKTSGMIKDGLDVLDATPFGNSITLDFAEAAIDGENLGQGKFTDFLAISISSTDLVGHQFGPNSVEMEDTYLRLDKDLGDFLKYLDKKIGVNNYLVFLTADHGVANAADYSAGNNIPAGSFNIDSVMKLLNVELKKKFNGNDWIMSHENMQFYLNHELIDKTIISRQEVFNATREFMMKFDAIADIIDLENIGSSSLQPELKTIIANGYNAKRSGDFEIVYNPGWLEGFTKGATHGTLYPYDTHIPLIWFGWYVGLVRDYSEVNMTDIAPTLAALLHIQEPDGCVGKVIQGLVK